mgnify:CR=1 FL=1
MINYLANGDLFEMGNYTKLGNIPNHKNAVIKASESYAIIYYKKLSIVRSFPLLSSVNALSDCVIQFT